MQYNPAGLQNTVILNYRGFAHAFRYLYPLFIYPDKRAVGNKIFVHNIKVVPVRMMCVFICIIVI